MYEFSQKSKYALASANSDLQKVFNEVIKHMDCTVIYGHRGRDEQEEMVRKGYSSLHFPKSKHNAKPSFAVDVVPYFSDHNPGIDWNDREKFVYFAGFVKGIASQMGVKIRWGGDWDSDNDLHDQTWMDLPHFELTKRATYTEVNS